jgi:hypothetical protein
MISEANLAELEARNIDYIIGVRERGTKEIRGVIADPAPYVPLSIPKAAGRGTTDLLVEEVNRSGRHASGKPWRRHYIVCLNEAEAKKDAAERAAIVAALDEALRRGDKSLVGNRGYRRFLKSRSGGRFEIDPRRVALDALYDGISVIRVTMKLTPCRRPCATATAGWSKTSFARVSRCSPPVPSFTNTTRPFAATSSARSWL